MSTSRKITHHRGYDGSNFTTVEDEIEGARTRLHALETLGQTSTTTNSGLSYISPATLWIEMDAFQPGIVTRQTIGGTTSFTQAYLTEKIAALHGQGYRQFIIHTVTGNTRTYTEWGITTPVDPDGVTFDYWYNDVDPGVQPNVDNFDILAAIISICDALDGARVIVGLGQHDDVQLLNDIYTTSAFGGSGADPMRFSKTVATRLAEEITRYTVESADVYDRFGSNPSFGGFFISHESDHLQSSADLYIPLSAVLRDYGEVHISVSTPIDFADSNAIADAIISYKVDWIWAQTSAGYGYNWGTGTLAYVGAISIFGSAAHMATWRDLIERARLRTDGSWTPRLGVQVENWRLGVQGSGILTFGALTGTNITVTLGTASSVVSADIGKDIVVRADQATGVARVVSITDTTHIKVDISENLADVNIAAGFWALVPDLTDATVDAYPASATEIEVEIAQTSSYVDDISISAEAYWDPGNLSLVLKQSQSQVTDYRTRASNGWNTHAIHLAAALNAARYIAWNNRGLEDPAADRIVFFDDSAGASQQGSFAYLRANTNLEIAGTDLNTSLTPTFTSVTTDNNATAIAFVLDGSGNSYMEIRAAGVIKGYFGYASGFTSLAWLDSAGTSVISRLSNLGSFVPGTTSALATNATDGFLYVPSCAGPPTGAPTAFTGKAAIVIDSTNNKLYFYTNGTWRDAGP